MATHLARIQRLSLGVGLALLATAMGGCEPCGLFFSCKQAPVAAVIGQVVDRETGVPIRDAVVRARRVDGVTLRAATIETRTAPDGYFQLAAPADSVGTAWLELTIAAPGELPYVVPRVRADAELTTGDASVLPPWVSGRPEIPFALSIHSVAAGAGVGGATVTFTRTGGRRLFVGDVPVPSIQGETGDGGIIFLFDAASTDTTGDLIGSVTVSRPGVASFTVPDVVVTAVPRFRSPHSLIPVTIP
jgi:hypothetical protein